MVRRHSESDLLFHNVDEDSDGTSERSLVRARNVQLSEKRKLIESGYRFESETRAKLATASVLSSSFPYWH